MVLPFFPDRNWSSKAGDIFASLVWRICCVHECLSGQSSNGPLCALKKKKKRSQSINTIYRKKMFERQTRGPKWVGRRPSMICKVWREVNEFYMDMQSSSQRAWILISLVSPHLISQGHCISGVLHSPLQYLLTTVYTGGQQLALILPCPGCSTDSF